MVKVRNIFLVYGRLRLWNINFPFLSLFAALNWIEVLTFPSLARPKLSLEAGEARGVAAWEGEVSVWQVLGTQLSRPAQAALRARKSAAQSLQHFSRELRITAVHFLAVLSTLLHTAPVAVQLLANFETTTGKTSIRCQWTTCKLWIACKTNEFSSKVRIHH